MAFHQPRVVEPFAHTCTGWWTSSRGGSGTLSTQLNSTGNTFSGYVTFGGSDCYDREFSVGSVDGSTVTVGVSGNSIIFVGTLSDSTISGVYEVYSGGCVGDTGLFAISK